MYNIYFIKNYAWDSFQNEYDTVVYVVSLLNAYVLDLEATLLWRIFTQTASDIKNTSLRFAPEHMWLIM